MDKKKILKDKRGDNDTDAATDLFEDACKLKPKKPLVMKGFKNAKLTPEQLKNSKRKI